MSLFDHLDPPDPEGGRRPGGPMGGLLTHRVSYAELARDSSAAATRIAHALTETAHRTRGASHDASHGASRGPVPVPDGLASMRPGLELGQVLVGIPVRRVSGHDTVEVMAAAYRQVCQAQAVFLSALLETGMRRAFSEDIVSRVETPGEFAAEEARAALVWSRRRADTTFGFAWDIHERLPMLGEAMYAGVLDEPRARAFTQWTVGLSDDHAAQVVAELLPQAGGLLVGELIDRIKRLAIAIDPGWAERRYKAAVRGRRVEGSRNDDGTANIHGLDLPVDRAAAACDRITTLARACKRAGDARPINHIRVDLYLGMLDGTFEDLDEDAIIAHVLAHPFTDPPEDSDGNGGGNPAGGGTGPAGDDGPTGEDPAGDGHDGGDGPAGHGPTGNGSAGSGPTNDDPAPANDEHDGAGDGEDVPVWAARGTEKARDDRAEHPDHEPDSHGDSSGLAGDDPTGGDGGDGSGDGCGPGGGPANADALASDASDAGSKSSPWIAEPAAPGTCTRMGAQTDPAAQDTAEPGPATAAAAASTAGPPGPATPGSATSGAETPPAGTPGSATSGAGAAGWSVRELRVEVAALLGMNEHPAEIVGWDFIPAALARTIITTMTAAEWRWVICDNHGHPIDNGITSQRPHPTSRTSGSDTGSDTGSIGPPAPRRRHDHHRHRGRGIVELHLRADELSRLAAGADDGPLGWGTVLADIAHQHATTSPRGHPESNDAHRRSPGAALRRAIQIRDRSCTHPSCRAPASRTDQDHAVDHGHGGPTTEANLGSCCRHDHRVKHDGGWRLTKPAPDTTVWVSPLGHTYINRPPPIMPTLPKPQPAAKTHVPAVRDMATLRKLLGHFHSERGIATDTPPF